MKRQPRAITFALPAVGVKCVEARMGSPIGYVPCGQPALRIISHRNGETYPMCLACADHNVRNRGARYVEQGENYTLTPIVYASLTEAIDIAADSPTTPLPNYTAHLPSSLIEDIHKNSKLPDEALDIEAAPEAGEGELSKITKLAQRQLEIIKEIETLEKALANKQSELKVNQETDLPEALDAAGVKQFALSTGQEIELKSVVSAGITKANQDKGFALLENIGWGALIKRTFEIKFDRKDEAFIRKFERDLAKRKRKLDVAVKMSVNSRSLAKSIRENEALTADDEDRIDLALPVPGLDVTREKLLGVWRVRKAVVATGAEAEEDDAAIL